MTCSEHFRSKIAELSHEQLLDFTLMIYFAATFNDALDAFHHEVMAIGLSKNQANGENTIKLLEEIADDWRRLKFEQPNNN